MVSNQPTLPSTGSLTRLRTADPTGAAFGTFPRHAYGLATAGYP
jgi:hypothetical protein